jgi:DNA-binding transcriptional ArsR family regulator
MCAAWRPGRAKQASFSRRWRTSPGCDLLHGEKSVGELESLLARRQSTVSQQLARLRLEGLVAARRDGKTIYYSIASDKARSIIGSLYDSFCNTGGDA